MLYSSKDTLNPFTCVTTQNKVLTQLMYDSLLVLKNNYETEYKIAKNITYENKVLSILLSDVKFTDGTPLTAADVVFSFEAAKKSKNYSSSLNFAVSAVAEDPKHVTIILSRDDPYFVNLLTFPIIKSGSDTLTDSDNRLLPPIGSGRYIFDVDAKKLTVNKNHNGGVAKIDSVAVTDCPDNESISQTLSIGAIDFYFTDLGDDVIPKMNGTAADVTQSRIVFL
jgi:peptide/nickel transport system substrate-binding protein